MAGLIILSTYTVVLGASLLLLHHQSVRVGFAPFMILIGGLTLVLQSQLGIYSQPTPDIQLRFSQMVLVPVLLMAVLTVYVSNGGTSALLMMSGMVFASAVLLLILYVYSLAQMLPQAQIFNDLPVPEPLWMNTGQTLAFPLFSSRLLYSSILTFIGDMFVIVLVYQLIHNAIPRAPEWLSVGIALLTALWFDGLLISLLADINQPEFVSGMVNGLISKTLGGLLLWPLVAVYLSVIAPRNPAFVGGANRPLFDIVAAQGREMRRALAKEQAARQQLEAERLRELRYYEQIVTGISDALWLSDARQQRVFFVNPAYRHIWGLEGDTSYPGDAEFFAKSLHPEDRDRVMAGLSEQLSGNYVVEYRIVRPDGEMRWIRERAFPMTDDQGKVYRIVGISTDITAQKLEEAERFQLELERQKMALLREFVADVTHDLKTPLSSINLKIYQITRTIEPSERTRLLEEVRSESDRMGLMISDLLMLSRLESLNESTLLRTELNKLLLDVTGNARSRAREKDIAIIERLAEPSPLVMADRDDLQRALSNLVENALHYTLPGGQIEITTRFDSDQTVLTVKDSGIGIPPEELQHIFTRYFRASNVRERVPTGTGLGLAIVKKVVEQHKGSISVSSELGVGTVFTIILPRFITKRNPTLQPPAR